MLIKVPQDATPDMVQFCRDVNDMFNLLLGGNNIDLKGRRIILAGNAVDPQDYVTRADVVSMMVAAGLKVNPDGSAQQFASSIRSSSSFSSGSLAGELARASFRP